MCEGGASSCPTPRILSCRKAPSAVEPRFPQKHQFGVTASSQCAVYFFLAACAYHVGRACALPAPLCPCPPPPLSARAGLAASDVPAAGKLAAIAASAKANAQAARCPGGTTFNAAAHDIHAPPRRPPATRSPMSVGLSALIFNFFICFASSPWEMYSLGALYK